MKDYQFDHEVAMTEAFAEFVRSKPVPTTKHAMIPALDAPDFQSSGKFVDANAGREWRYMQTEYIHDARPLAYFLANPSVVEREKFVQQWGALLEWLHRNRIYHGDLSPTNVLLAVKDGMERWFVIDVARMINLDEDFFNADAADLMDSIELPEELSENRLFSSFEPNTPVDLLERLLTFGDLVLCGRHLRKLNAHGFNAYGEFYVRGYRNFTLFETANEFSNEIRQWFEVKPRPPAYYTWGATVAMKIRWSVP